MKENLKVTSIVILALLLLFGPSGHLLFTNYGEKYPCARLTPTECELKKRGYEFESRQDCVSEYKVERRFGFDKRAERYSDIGDLPVYKSGTNCQTVKVFIRPEELTD